MFDLNKLFLKFPELDLDENYYLREMRLSDAAWYMQYYNKPEISRFVPENMIPKDIAHAKSEMQDVIDAFKYKHTIYWGIARKDSDELIGGVGFHDWNKYHMRVEVAYDLEPDYWRRGIMMKAVRNIFNFAFCNMGIIRITATTIQENTASNNLLLKFGFKYEGLLKKYKYFHGKMYDIMIFSYTMDDYNRDVNLGKYLVGQK